MATALSDKVPAAEFVPLADVCSLDPKPLVHIWGNGDDHGASYPITKGRTKLKLNIDQHDDLRSSFSGVGATNHMGRSQEDGIRVITGICTTAELNNAIIIAMGYNPDEVGITIDLDGVLGFPVLKRYVPGLLCRVNLNILQVVEMINTLNNRVLTLDLGGLIEDVPDFDVVPVDLAKPPKRSELLEFLGVNPHGRLNSIATNVQALIDYICSYSIEASAAVLNAFIRTRG